MRKKLEFKFEDGKVYSREVPKCETSLAGNCYYCGEEIYASPGQAIKYVRPAVTILNANEERGEHPCHRKCLKQNK